MTITTSVNELSKIALMACDASYVGKLAIADSKTLGQSHNSFSGKPQPIGSNA